MKEQEKMLKSCRKEIEVLHLRVSIPDIEDYKNVLLRLFNNKREDKDILDITNFYQNNDIEVSIDLTSYMNEMNKTKEEVIEHLKHWVVSGLDMLSDNVKVEINKAYVYDVYDQFEWFDKDDNFIQHYVREDL